MSKWFEQLSADSRQTPPYGAAMAPTTGATYDAWRGRLT